MAKTEVLTKEGLLIYDEEIKNYIDEHYDNSIYIDPNETSTEVGEITPSEYADNVSYNNAESGLTATTVQGAIDEIGVLKRYGVWGRGIPAETNANDVLSPGVYYCFNMVANVPYINGFLIVFDPGDYNVVQLNVNFDGKCAIRVKFGGIWCDWNYIIS